MIHFNIFEINVGSLPENIVENMTYPAFINYISCGFNIFYMLLANDELYYIDHTCIFTKVEVPSHIKIDKIWCQNDSNDLVILAKDKQIYCRGYMSYNMNLCSIDNINKFTNITPSTRKSFYKTLDDGINDDNIVEILSIITS